MFAPKSNNIIPPPLLEGGSKDNNEPNFSESKALLFTYVVKPMAISDELTTNFRFDASATNSVLGFCNL
jgi:hypothetical protein